MKFGISTAEGEGVAACGMAIAAADDSGPVRRLQLLTMGLNVGRDGRQWTVENAAHAAAIVAATKARAGAHLVVIDYDHQSVFAAVEGVGGQAPAAGWMSDFEADETGVYAAVDWTPPATEQLANRQYRYVSPFFGFDKVTGKVTRIFNAALTNNPNFELPAVASADLSPPENTDLKLRPQLLTALGLNAEATDEQIVAAATEQHAAASAATHLTSIAKTLGLDDKAEGSAVASAVTARLTAAAGDPDPTKWSPKSVVDDLVAQVNEMQGGLTEDKATAAVELAVQEGKLAPALVDSWAKPYALKDLAGFKAWASAAPVVLAPGETTNTKGAANAGEPVLSAEQKAACAAIGVDEAAYLETLKAAQ